MLTPLFSHKAKLSLILGLFCSLTLISQPGVNEQLALQFYQNGEYTKAAELYQQIYKTSPSPYFYNYTLNSLVRANDLKGAEKFVKNVASANPKNVKYEVEIGYVLELSGEPEKADKLFKKLISKALPNRNYYTELSDAFQVREKYLMAEETLKKGLKKFDPPLYFELADLYMAQMKYQQMIGVYLDMVEDRDEYLDVAKNKLQLAITDDQKGTISEALKDELLLRADKTGLSIYQELLFWYSIQKKDFALALIQAKALDKQFNESGERVFQLTNILISNDEYSKAIDGLEYITKLGEGNRFYRNAEMNLLLAKFKLLISKTEFDNQEISNLITDYEKVINKYGKNASTFDLLYNLAHIKAFYIQDSQGAEEILEQLLIMPGVRQEQIAQVKMELADALLFEGRIWSASLLYKQVEKMFKDDEIGFDARFRSAKFFYYVGEMDYAKVQLDVLKGATAKLIANDAMELALLIESNMDPDSTYSSLTMFANADLLNYQRKFDEALITLDSLVQIFPGYPIIDDMIYKKATIYLQKSDYMMAIRNFEIVANDFSTESNADNALWQLANIFEFKTLDIEKARKAYERIILDHPGSIYVNDARKRYNDLKNRNLKL